MVFELPSNVPENGVPLVPMPLVHVHPDMLMFAVNLYEFDLTPVSFNHCNFAAVSISYTPLTSDAATPVGQPVSANAGEVCETTAKAQLATIATTPDTETIRRIPIL